MSGRPANPNLPSPAYTPRDFAPDANYPAGSDPWSGQPTKVEPPGAASTGFVPGTGAGAQFFNKVLRDGFNTQADQKTYEQSLRDATNAYAQALRDFVALQQFEIRVGGSLLERYLPSTKLFYAGITAARGYDGAANVIPAQGAAAIATTHGSNVDELGNIVQLGSNNTSGVDVTEFNVGTQTWTKHPGAFAHALQVGNVEYDPVSGLWCAAAMRLDTHTAQVYTSPDRATWTERTAPAMPTDGASGPICGLGSDRAGKLVMSSVKGFFIGSATTDSVSFSLSTDGGVTWSTPDTHAMAWGTTASSGEAPVPHWDGTKWVCVVTNRTDNSMYVYNSTDGATWTQVLHLTGQCIVDTIGCDILSGLLAGTTKDGQIVYSDDHGASWKRTGVVKSGTASGGSCAAGRFFFNIGGTNYCGNGSGVDVGGTL